MPMSFAHVVGVWLSQMGQVGEGLESSGALGMSSGEGFVGGARGVFVRKLLQSGGSSSSQQPGDNFLGDSMLSIFLALGFCIALFVVMLWRRYCLLRRRRRLRSAAGVAHPHIQDPPSAALPYDILKSLPIVSFKKEGDSQTFNQEHSENQCPICLIEFEPKDSLRKLPECSHYFHQSCVDEWFKRNHTCPLCRTSLLPAEELSAPEDPVAATAAETTAPDAMVIPMAHLEQGAGHAAPHLPPLEREGPVVNR